ncbi:hypothetical protein [Caballeronia sp. HLA56]
MPIYSLIKQASRNAQHVLEKYPESGANPDALRELATAVEQLQTIPSRAWDAAESLMLEAGFFYSEHCTATYNDTWRRWVREQSREDMFIDVLRIRLEAIKYLNVR